MIESKLMILLASNSPRRQQMLAWTGWPFVVRPVDIDETPRSGELPLDYVRRLAAEKAQAARPHAGDCTHIFAADTIVVLGEEILGKPADAGEAAAMLRLLRGKTHQVFTAITVIDIPGEEFIQDLCISDVPMRCYTEEELQSYVASGDPLDKAGGYAIQHAGFHPVEGFGDCFASVAGMPLCHLQRSMASLGIKPEKDIPGSCQKNLAYNCPVYQTILNGKRN